MAHKNQQEYNKKYLSNYEDIKIRVVAGERDIIRDYAVSHGWKSLNQCVTNLLNYVIANGLTAEDFRIRRDNQD